MDAHIFHCVVDTSAQKIAPQSALKADFGPQVSLGINVIGAQEGIITIEQIQTELQFAPQEPRLDERHLVILTLGPDRQPQSELLAAAPEPGRLKVAFVVLGDADE